MRTKLALLFIIIMVFSSVNVFAAKKTYRTEANNNVSIGDVNISLDEYTLDENGKEVPFPLKAIVLPGDDLAKIVRITNIAQDAWVRVKLTFINEEKMTGVDESMITFSSPSEWKKIGDYYYALKPIKSGTTVEFMKSLHIPNSWTEAYCEKEFKLIVSADAVQMRNFTPDFNSNDPWFGTIIEQCVHDSYTEPLTPGKKDFSVEFRGGAEGFIRIGDDFFSNWGELMPGDTVSDKIEIRNRYKKGVKLYFKTKNLAGEKLLKQLDLKITATDGTVIFDGKMDSALTKGILLGEYPTDTSGYLEYTLHVPEELRNEYATLNARVKWIFEAELDDSIKSEKKDKDKSEKSEPGESGTSGGTGSLRNVKTGDESNIYLYIGLCFAAILLICSVSKRSFAYSKNK